MVSRMPDELFYAHVRAFLHVLHVSRFSSQGQWLTQELYLYE